MASMFRRILATILAFALLTTGTPALAGMISTDAVVSPGHRDRLAATLARAEVREQLVAFGVDADAAAARVAAMTEEEAASLNGRIESAPAGGLLGTIVFVFVLLLVTDILGLTKVFPFTRPVR